MDLFGLTEEEIAANAEQHARNEAMRERLRDMRKRPAPPTAAARGTAIDGEAWIPLGADGRRGETAAADSAAAPWAPLTVSGVTGAVLLTRWAGSMRWVGG